MPRGADVPEGRGEGAVLDLRDDQLRDSGESGTNVPPTIFEGEEKKVKKSSVVGFSHSLFFLPLPLSLFPPFPGQPGRPPCLRRVPYHAHVRARGAEREMRRLQLRDPDLEAPSSASRLYPAAAAVFGPSVRGAAAAAAGAVFAAAGADRGG